MGSGFDELTDAGLADLLALDRHLQLSSDDVSRFDRSAEQLRSDLVRRAGGEAQDQARWPGGAGDRIFRRRLETLEGYLVHLQTCYGRGELPPGILEEADEVARCRGLVLDPDASSFRDFAAALLASRIGTTRELIDRQQGSPTVTPPEPVPLAPAVNSRLTEGRTLRDLVDAFVTEKTRPQRRRAAGVSRSTRVAYEAVARLCYAVLGENRQVASITRADGEALLDTIFAMPRNVRKNALTRNLTIMEAIEVGRAKGLPTLAPKTINDTYVPTLRQLFGWGVDEGWLSTNPIPAQRAAFDPVPDDKKRDPFTISQLNVIFRSDHWSRPPGDEDGAPLRYWGPLIGLFMGLRVGEIAQLRVQDFSQREGVWMVAVAADAGKNGRTFKTESARRDLPLHPELERLGLVEYMLRQKNKALPLWPGEGPNSREQWGVALGRWFSRRLAALKVSGTRLGMHSFRHNFQDRLREAELHGTELGAYLAGRRRVVAADREGHNYGGGHSVRKLSAAMSAVCYPELVIGDPTAMIRQAVERGEGVH